MGVTVCVPNSRSAYSIHGLRTQFTACIPNSRGQVGNSGTVLFEEFGVEIDAHEMVYRFNQGPTLGYEKSIGNHTMFESLNAKFAHQVTPTRLFIIIIY
jgi:hypothetical protein